MECQQCKTYLAVIDELGDEIARMRNRRRSLFTTIRLLRQQVIRQMEQEHEADNTSLSQADGFAE